MSTSSMLHATLQLCTPQLMRITLTCEAGPGGPGGPDSPCGPGGPGGPGSPLAPWGPCGPGGPGAAGGVDLPQLAMRMDNRTAGRSLLIRIQILKEDSANPQNLTPVLSAPRTQPLTDITRLLLGKGWSGTLLKISHCFPAFFAPSGNPDGSRETDRREQARPDQSPDPQPTRADACGRHEAPCLEAFGNF
jgi:hypothetical protein